ncbi:MAG: EF-hand domain-containing protein [Spirochaetota bacterium]
MNYLRILFGIAFIAAFICSISYVSAQQRSRPMMKCEENFASMDADKDGKVSLKEFMTVKHPRGNAEDVFKAKDTDKDGFLSKEEFCSKGPRQRKGRAD